MTTVLYQIYLKLPAGKFKAILKNIFNFFLFTFAYKTEVITVRGEKILCFKDPLTDNKLLAKEITGYNLFYKLKKGDVVIDAGAYTGLFSIYASKRIGDSGRVFAFEIDPFNFILLRKNIKLNHLKNVCLIKKGVYSKDLVLPIEIHGTGSKIAPVKKKEKFINKVQVIALDNELKRLKISDIDFVKMDIEGAQMEAVRGLNKTLKKSKKINLAIASYDIVNDKPSYISLEPFFRSMGMFVTTDYKPHLTTYASKLPLNKS